MTLQQQQSKFALAVAALIQQAEVMGFEMTFGETYRPPETAALFAQQGKGSSNSLHSKRLAIDLNLFKDNKYLAATKDHLELGVWWEELGKAKGWPLYWGGRFQRADGNHYSWSPDGGKTR